MNTYALKALISLALLSSCTPAPAEILGQLQLQQGGQRATVLLSDKLCDFPHIFSDLLRTTQGLLVVFEKDVAPTCVCWWRVGDQVWLINAGGQILLVNLNRGDVI